MSDQIQTSRYTPAPPVQRTNKGNGSDNGSMLNVPNTLCMIRFTGSIVLVALAFNNATMIFFWTFMFLVFTDWIDGKLANLLHQRTNFGARLDSVADATLYAALLFGLFWLMPDFVSTYAAWIVAVAISYAMTSGLGLIRFGRVPSYHTWAAKSSDHLMTIAVICLFTGWATWPALFAMAVVVLTNLEAIAISFILRQWRADVPTIYHAIKLRKQGV